MTKEELRKIFMRDEALRPIILWREAEIVRISKEFDDQIVKLNDIHYRKMCEYRNLQFELYRYLDISPVNKHDKDEFIANAVSKIRDKMKEVNKKYSEQEEEVLNTEIRVNKAPKF